MLHVYSAECQHSLPLELGFVLSGLQTVLPGIVGAPTIGEVLDLTGDLEQHHQQYEASSPPCHCKSRSLYEDRAQSSGLEAEWVLIYYGRMEQNSCCFHIDDFGPEQKYTAASETAYTHCSLTSLHQKRLKFKYFFQGNVNCDNLCLPTNGKL